MEPRFNGRIIFHKGPGYRHGRCNVTEVITHRCVVLTSPSHTTEGDDDAAGKRRMTAKESGSMTRILTTIGIVLLLTSPSLAQSYCAQVRQAVATYGYAAAKRHAMAHYTAREVRAADRCVTRRSRRG